jgi:type I restriction enzyme S subunit
MNNLDGGQIDSTDLKFVTLSSSVEASYLVRQNDILFNRTNSYALVGKTALVDRPIKAVFASYLIRMEPDCSKIEPRYLAQLLISEKWQAKIRALATKGVSQSNINIQNLLRLQIPVRPLKRQKIIADFLQSVDASSSATQQILSQLSRTKAALMQGLLLPNPKTRTKFKVHALGELFAERKESGKPGLPTLSVTMHDGMVDREEHGRRVASELTPEDHLLAHKHDIAYNMMRMWQGVSGLAPFKGLVSPAYVVLKPLAGIDPLFGSYLFKLPETIRLFHRYSQGLTNDRLRLYYDQFAEIRVPIPSDIKEQRRIASLLTTLDRQIEQSKSLVKSLRQTKAAICQQLFS